MQKIDVVVIFLQENSSRCKRLPFRTAFGKAAQQRTHLLLIAESQIKVNWGSGLAQVGGKAVLASSVRFSPPLAPSRLRAFQAGIFLPSFSLIFNDLHICLCPFFGLVSDVCCLILGCSFFCCFRGLFFVFFGFSFLFFFFDFLLFFGLFFAPPTPPKRLSEKG